MTKAPYWMHLSPEAVAPLPDLALVACANLVYWRSELQEANLSVYASRVLMDLAILGALDWLDRAASPDSNPAATTPSESPERHPVIEQLANYISVPQLSYEVVGKQIGVSSGAVSSWLRGTAPKGGNLQKVRSFLSSVSSTPAALSALAKSASSSSDSVSKG